MVGPIGHPSYKTNRPGYITHRTSNYRYLVNVVVFLVQGRVFQRRVFLGNCRQFLGNCRQFLGNCRHFLGNHRQILPLEGFLPGSSRGTVGSSWGTVGSSWGTVGSSWGTVGSSLGTIGRSCRLMGSYRKQQQWRCGPAPYIWAWVRGKACSKKLLFASRHFEESLSRNQQQWLTDHHHFLGFGLGAKHARRSCSLRAGTPRKLCTETSNKMVTLETTTFFGLSLIHI